MHKSSCHIILFTEGDFVFVINGKRLLFIFGSICIALIVPAFIMASKNTVETVALPTTNRVIILDAGHGKPDEGAASSNGITESDINLQITMKVKKLLEDVGAKVILTRSDENGIYDASATTIRQKKVSDIKKRVEIGNNSDADIFISIHLNKIDQSQYYGWQTFYKEGNEQSTNLAKSIQAKLNETIQRENHREAHSINNVYIVEHVTIPISIVECGFLSNPEEEKLLQQDDYQNKLAIGIFLGIVEYFGIQ